MTAAVKAIVCRVGETPKVEQLEDTLPAWQKLVDGYIEIVHLDDGVYIVCNDEGRFTQPFNRLVPGRAANIDEKTFDVIVGPKDRPPPGEFGMHEMFGTFAIVRTNWDNGEFCSLVDRDVTMWLPALIRTGRR